MVHAVEDKIREIIWLTMMSLSLYFPEISYSLLHEIVSEKMNYLKLYAHWDPKMLTEPQKNETTW